MQIKFYGLADIIVSSVAQVGLNFVFEIIKITEMELREENNLSHTQLTCYPNPATDYLNITGVTEECLLQIFNNSGQLCIEQSITAGNNLIDLQLLPAGQYNVICNTNNGLQQNNFIKLK